MNKADIVVGLQYGDEAKGRLVDYLVSHNSYTHVARYQGGANSGHTVIIDGKKTVFRVLPSSAMNHGVVMILGCGMVVDPVILVDEIDRLIEAGVNPIIKMSDSLHITHPIHRLIDVQTELDLGSMKIGSTCRGNTPTYVDKISRRGIRAIDLMCCDIDELLHKHHVMHSKDISPEVYKSTVLSIFGLESKPDAGNYNEYSLVWTASVRRIRELIKSGVVEMLDTSGYTIDAIRNGKVLIEGAQGFGLDIDHGSYPNVSSSNMISGAACVGLGIPPSAIGRVFGVSKIYSTRIGTGEFRTEISTSEGVGKHILEVGKEYGSTTGRPRRVGWIDARELTRSCMINGVTDLAIMKCDVIIGKRVMVDDEYYDIPDIQFNWNKPLVNLCRYIASIVCPHGKLSFISYGADRNEILDLSYE